MGCAGMRLATFGAAFGAVFAFLAPLIYNRSLHRSTSCLARSRRRSNRLHRTCRGSTCRWRRTLNDTRHPRRPGTSASARCSRGSRCIPCDTGRSRRSSYRSRGSRIRTRRSSRDRSRNRRTPRTGKGFGQLSRGRK